VLIVALTGGIACGKSVVADLLRAKGCYIDSADAAAHALMLPGSDAWRGIVDHFGQAVLRPDRTIDRSRLGAIVFADAAERAFLDALVHPLVLRRIEDLIAEVGRGGRHRIFVSEAALVFESGFAARFDKIVVVDCPEESQVARLEARDGLGRDEALRRIRSQMPGQDKVRRADYVIDTSGSPAETVEQTERVYAMLVRDAEIKTALGR
jgi:dephospho-CoA kinase